MCIAAVAKNPSNSSTSQSMAAARTAIAPITTVAHAPTGRPRAAAALLPLNAVCDAEDADELSVGLEFAVDEASEAVLDVVAVVEASDAVKVLLRPGCEGWREL